MTPSKFAEDNDFSPLSAVELKRGKHKIKIPGTDDLMPWEEVYTRIGAGMSMEHIVHIYGNARKVTLWAIQDGIDTNQVISDLLDSEIEQRHKMKAIQDQSPTAAITIHEMANEYAPDAVKNIALFSDKLIREATTALDNKRKTSLDMINLAKAVQTASDILGHTQRHANANSLTHNEIKVEGFTIALDKPPEHTYTVEELDALEATVIPSAVPTDP